MKRIAILVISSGCNRFIYSFGKRSEVRRTLEIITKDKKLVEKPEIENLISNIEYLIYTMTGGPKSRKNENF